MIWNLFQIYQTQAYDGQVKFFNQKKFKVNYIDRAFLTVSLSRFEG